MPGCVLRVVGSTRKVRQFLASSSFKPTKVYYKGEPGFIKSRGPTRISGFNLTLSGSDGSSISKQAKEAVRFIKRHQEEFNLLKALKFKEATLDFGLWDLATEDRPWPIYRLPRSIIDLASKYGFDIELSFYGKS